MPDLPYCFRWGHESAPLPCRCLLCRMPIVPCTTQQRRAVDHPAAIHGHRMAYVPSCRRHTMLTVSRRLGTPVSCCEAAAVHPSSSNGARCRDCRLSSCMTHQRNELLVLLFRVRLTVFSDADGQHLHRSSIVIRQYNSLGGGHSNAARRKFQGAAGTNKFHGSTDNVAIDMSALSE